MMNLVLLAAALSFGAPPAQPAGAELDSQKAVITVCSEEATTVVSAVSPGEQEALSSPACTQPEASLGGNELRDVENLGFRYCCTTQQSIACAAIGGTTTCRTGVCQCQF